jgi:hypothetical protein
VPRLKTFTEKDQIVNILGFKVYIVFGQYSKPKAPDYIQIKRYSQRQMAGQIWSMSFSFLTPNLER